MAAGSRSTSCAPRSRHVLGVQTRRPPTPTWPTRWRRPRRRPAVARAALRRAGGGVPARRRPVVESWRDRLNAATMLGQSKSVQQAEIDAACELADFLRFNVHFARQILEQQPQLARACGTGWSTGRSRASCSRSPRSTSPRSRATCPPRRRCWATCGVEAVADAAARRALHHAAVRGGRAAAGRDQHGHRRRRGRQRGRAAASRARGRALHRLDRDLPAPVARDRRRIGSTRLPAHRRRDRRQGLRRRAPVGGSGRARDRTGPRRVRVPGPEVLGGVARVHPALAVGRRGARRAGRDDRDR